MLEPSQWDAGKAIGQRARPRLRWYLTPHVLLLISTLIYFSPYVVGSFEYIMPSGQRYQREYSAEVGVAAAFVLAMLFFCAMFIGKRNRQIAVRDSTSVESKVLAALIVAAGLYVLISGQAGIVNKRDLLDQTDRIDLSFYLLCSLGFIFSALTGYKKHKGLLGVSLLGLLFVAYLGHRSSLVIAIIGAAYVRFRDQPIPRIPVKYVIAAVILFFVVAVYKSIYVAIKLERWDLVMERLSTQNILQSSMTGMEQFTTFAHLDFVVSDNFRLACSNAWLMPFTLIPYSDTVLNRIWDVSGCYYNSQIQPVFFPGYSGGVAANIWAEFFAYCGYLGFPILIGILSLFYGLIEYLIRRSRSPILVSGLIVALVNMSFYIQRKELFGAFISSKRAVTIALIAFSLAWVLRKVNRRISHA